MDKLGEKCTCGGVETLRRAMHYCSNRTQGSQFNQFVCSSRYRNIRKKILDYHIHNEEYIILLFDTEQLGIRVDEEYITRKTIEL